jgi:hypothetical protein
VLNGPLGVSSVDGAGNPIPATYLAALRTNLDGFASDVGTLSWTAASDTPDFVTLSIDLSAAMFQGLSVADLAGVGGSLQLKFLFAMTSCPPIGGVNLLATALAGLGRRDWRRGRPSPDASGVLAR